MIKYFLDLCFISAEKNVKKAHVQEVNIFLGTLLFIRPHLFFFLSYFRIVLLIFYKANVNISINWNIRECHFNVVHQFVL